jgi:TP901 family phage tail tape measure protein
MASAADLLIAIKAVDDASPALEKVSRSLGGVGDASSKVGGHLGVLAAAGGTAAVGLAAAAFKIGEEFDSAYDKIAVATGATGDKLEGLQDDFKAVATQVPASFDVISGVVGGLAQRTGQTGESLQNLSAQVVELARITGTDASMQVANVTRLFGDWSVATEDQTGALDRVFRASQATGIGTDQLMQSLVQFGAPLRQFGFSLDEAAALMGKWEKEGVNSELVLGSLRIAMGQFAQDGIPMRQGLDDTIKKIQALGPGAEATSIAMKTFGARAGPDMAAAILEGRFALGDLLDKIKNGEGTIRGTANSTADGAEKMQLAFNKMKVAVEPVATAIFGLVGEMTEALLPVIEAVAPYVTAVAQAFANLPAPVKQAIAVIAAIAAGFIAIGAVVGPIIAIIGPLIGLFGGLGAAAGVAAAALPFIGAALALLLSPIGLVVLAIGAVVAAFVLFPGLRKTVGDAITGIIEGFVAIPGAIATGLGNLAHNLAVIIQNASGDLVAWIVRNGGEVWSIGSGIVSGIVNGIASAPGAIASTLSSILSSAIATAKHALGISSPSRVTRDQIGVPVAQGIAQGITSGQSIIDQAMNGLDLTQRNAAAAYFADVRKFGSARPTGKGPDDYIFGAFPEDVHDALMRAANTMLNVNQTVAAATTSTGAGTAVIAKAAAAAAKAVAATPPPAPVVAAVARTIQAQPPPPKPAAAASSNAESGVVIHVHLEGASIYGVAAFRQEVIEALRAAKKGGSAPDLLR